MTVTTLEEAAKSLRYETDLMKPKTTPDPATMKLALANIVRSYRRGELLTNDEDLAAYIDLTIPEIICEEPGE